MCMYPVGNNIHSSYDIITIIIIAIVLAEGVQGLVQRNAIDFKDIEYREHNIKYSCVKVYA